MITKDKRINDHDYYKFIPLILNLKNNECIKNKF